MNSPNTDFGERDENKTEEEISLYTVIAIDTIRFASLIFYEKILLPSRTKKLFTGTWGIQEYLEVNK